MTIVMWRRVGTILKIWCRDHAHQFQLAKLGKPVDNQNGIRQLQQLRLITTQLPMKLFFQRVFYNRLILIIMLMMHITEE
jgi:hypothetical protein